MLPPMLALLTTFSWQELRHHPWRSASAVVAVLLGVALALAVQLINASALAEFASAVSTVNGQPDLSLRPRQGLLDDALHERVAAQPGVAVAAITRRPHGYVVALVEGATRPTVNGEPIGTEAINLRHGDLLELAGTQMQFIQQ